MARHFSDGTPMDVIEERDAWEDDVLSDYDKNAKDNYYTGDYDKVLVPENIMKNFTSFINKVTDDIAKKAVASDKSNKFTVNELVKIEKDIVKNELINSGVSNPDKYVKNIVKYINNEYQPLIDMIDDSYINGIEGLNNDVSTVNNFIDDNGLSSFVFTDKDGKRFIAAEDIDNAIDGNYNIDEVLKKLNAQLTDRTHPDYPSGMPKYIDDDEKTFNDMLNLYLSEKHPDMNVAQWRNKLDDQEEINFNRWFDENAATLKDDNGHIEKNGDKDPGISPDVLSDESLKNIIGTLSERIL